MKQARLYMDNKNEETLALQGFHRLTVVIVWTGKTYPLLILPDG